MCYSSKLKTNRWSKQIFVLGVICDSKMNRVATGILLGIVFGFSCAYMWFKVGTYELVPGPVANIR